MRQRRAVAGIIARPLLSTLHLLPLMGRKEGRKDQRRKRGLSRPKVVVVGVVADELGVSFAVGLIIAVEEDSDAEARGADAEAEEVATNCRPFQAA